MGQFCETVQQNSISSYPKMLVGGSFGACSLGESWELWVSERLKGLCASIVSVQSVPEQPWHRLVSHNCCLAIPGLRNLRVLGRKGEKQSKILGLSNLGSKLGSQSQECSRARNALGDVGWSSPLSLWSSSLCDISAGSRQNSQGVTDPDSGGRMFPQERKGAGCKEHMASCARSSVPNSLGAACAQQISQQLRNTNDGRNYPIKLQGEAMEKNLPCEFLRKAAPRCRLGQTGFKSHLCLPLKTEFLEQCGLREW